MSVLVTGFILSTLHGLCPSLLMIKTKYRYVCVSAYICTDTHRWRVLNFSGKAVKKKKCLSCLDEGSLLT